MKLFYTCDFCEMRENYMTVKPTLNIKCSNVNANIYQKLKDSIYQFNVWHQYMQQLCLVNC